jgi:hypothetical protein
MVVGKDSPAKILEFSVNCQIFTSNASHWHFMAFLPVSVGRTRTRDPQDSLRSRA